MALIQVVEAANSPWMGLVGGGVDEQREWVEVPEPQGEEDAATRYRHPGHDGLPYLHESKLPPGLHIESHAHRTDEIIYVLEGEILLGSRVLGPGTSILVPGMTLYGFRAGPNGVRFLNYRGREDRSHLSKERFLAERNAAKAASASASPEPSESAST